MGTLYHVVQITTYLDGTVDPCCLIGTRDRYAADARFDEYVFETKHANWRRTNTFRVYSIEIQMNAIPDGKEPKTIRRYKRTRKG